MIIGTYATYMYIPFISAKIGNRLHLSIVLLYHVLSDMKKILLLTSKMENPRTAKINNMQRSEYRRFLNM